MKSIIALAACTLLLVACKKEAPEFHEFSATYSNVGTIGTSEHGKANVYDLKFDNGQLCGYANRIEAEMETSICLHFNSKEFGQRTFDLSDMVLASYYDDKEIPAHAIEVQVKLSTVALDSLVEGTFAGTFVRDHIMVEGQRVQQNDTIRVTDGRFKITPWWWHNS